MSDYPCVYKAGEPPLMNDTQLVSFVREKCGDEIGMLLHYRLFGHYKENEILDYLSALREASNEAEELSTTLMDLERTLEKLIHVLPAGGTLP